VANVGHLLCGATQLPLYGIGHDACFGHGGAELLGGAVEFWDLVADFVGFVDVDAGPVGRAAVLEVVGHERSRVSGMCATENIGEG
jgi:hypothetical protein